MSKYMFYCSNCHNTFCGEEGQKDGEVVCPKCAQKAMPTLKTEEEWKKKVEEASAKRESEKKAAPAEETFAEINVGNNSGNTVAQVLRFFAWISLILVIIAVAMLFSQEGVIAALAVLFGGGLEVTLLFAASEVLNLLQGIKNNMEEK